MDRDLQVYKDAKKVLKYDVLGKPKTVIYWLAELINPSAKVMLSDEHQDYKWLALEDACKYGKYEEMKETLKYFDKYIKTNIQR